MHSVTFYPTRLIRLVGLGLAAAALVAAATSSVAHFQASSPGSNLEPVGGSGALVEIVQGQETVLWTALSGTVGNITTWGWPSSDGTHDLGGAMVIERGENRTAGVVDFGEKPMAMRFEIDG